jgi:hypothetical protein
VGAELRRSEERPRSGPRHEGYRAVVPTDSRDPSDNPLENAPDDSDGERPGVPARHVSSGPLWRQPAGAVPGSPSYSFYQLT